MRAWEEKIYERQEAREEGLEEGRDEINRLNIRLIEDGRTDDLLRSAKDKAYQEKLLEEYKIGK